MAETDPNHIPKLGESIDGPSLVMIIDAVEKRRQNFPEEDLGMTLALVLLNIGHRFDPLRCVGKEWRGHKKDVVMVEGEPTCPNGHEVKKERGITLGWVINRD